MQPNGVKLTADPLPLLAHAQVVIDFTRPMVSTMLADLAAQARIVHVIGTTGFSAADERRILAATRHAVIVKSGNMSLGVNLLAALVAQAARALPDLMSRSWKCITSTRWTRRPARPMLGQAVARGARHHPGEALGQIARRP